MNNLIRICNTNLSPVFGGIRQFRKKTNRSKFSKAEGFITVSVVLAPVVLTGYTDKNINSTDKRPNLLIIHTDEQTFRSISCYENSWPDIKTPNIDFLANNGVRCEKFYSNHPVSTPSRTALLTGRYAQKSESYINDIPLKSDAQTFANILKQYKYVTGYSGKVHLAGGPYPGFTPKTNFGFEDNQYMFNNAHMKKIIIDENGLLQSPGGIGDEKTYTTDFLTDRTIDFIEKNKNKCWCYMVSFPDPHDPNSERPPYDTMFKPADMKIPGTFHLQGGKKVLWKPDLKGKNTGNISDTQFLRNHKALYYGMVTHIDDCVGRIFNYLNNNKLLGNTIIVYTTDHGEMMGEFSRFDKGIFFDASAKIPFIMYFPREIKSSSVVRKVISNIDFTPTILDMMNIPYKKKYFDGRSAAALLTGKSSNSWKNIAFLSMTGQVAVITDRYKLILRRNEEPWLIDLVTDPDEFENAIERKENRDTVRWLALKLKNYLKNNADPNWNDTLTGLYDHRIVEHKMYREPARQNARRMEISWKNELSNQLNSLLENK